MSRNGHKRSLRSRRTILAIAAALTGFGGIAVIAVNASAGSGSRAFDNNQSADATVVCPDVGNRLRDVPTRAQSDVNRALGELDTQVATAYQKLTSGAVDQQALISDLQQQRQGTIDRIANAIGPASTKRSGLGALSQCTIRQAAGNNGQNAIRNAKGGAGNAPVPPNAGLSAADFVDITTVAPNVPQRRKTPGASTGTFTSECGHNQNGHLNPDNVIVAPGVSNGAHHMHDYVGNVSTDAFSVNSSLAAAGTTCVNQDQSTYYWPVTRLLGSGNERDAGAPGGGQDLNVGSILEPADVTLTFTGSPVGKVTAMPRFMRIITGDAKAFTSGPADANASWSCTGFENRQLTDKYPLCPQNSDVVRTFNFQSCWDGRNIDSANHRTHVDFALPNGACPRGLAAIPELEMRLVYDVPGGALFAVDSFPEQLHKPVTDHGDFINVMTDGLMNKAVRCINSGQKC
ncbi:DUF1996 domain-containing protein [Streptomyces sp. NPDC006733]|uniref:DUF1996 domain-containing protein n=1 Tax=Streptomyces sp. NPDC006733 TaxID=3155460 RepID=UPI0034115942